MSFRVIAFFGCVKSFLKNAHLDSFLLVNIIIGLGPGTACLARFQRTLVHKSAENRVKALGETSPPKDSL